MSQSPKRGNAGGRSDASPPAPQFYDMSAPLTRPVTTLQVTSFTLREGMLPSLVVPDGSLYFGPVEEDGNYRIPTGCGIIFFRHDDTVRPTFVQAGAASGNTNTNKDGGGSGLVSYFFSRGVPQEVDTVRGDGARSVAGQAAAAFTALCKRYQQGDRYGGDWAGGLFHGEGVLTTTSFTYQGGWHQGLMHGKGTISYTRKYVDARPAAAGEDASSGVGVGTLLLKGLSYVTPFELVATAAAPKEYFGAFEAEHGRHGAGLMRYYNGDVYEGEWQNNCRHGRGKLRKLDGEIYEGDWANDMRQGYGKIMYPNGSLFKGLLQRDQRDGEGVMRFANGDEYFGSFVADRIEGHGTMKYRNGDVYHGAWHDQLRHGTGKFTLKRTGATMTGIFQNGLIHGEGTVVVPNVSTFVGTFVRGERTTGTMHWQLQPPQATQDHTTDAAGASLASAASPASDLPLAAATAPSVASLAVATASTSLGRAARKHYLCYQGEWHGEHMHGRGLLWYRNGDFFSGRFVKSLRHGPGNMRYAAEQAEFSGNFVHGVRHGLGLLQRADGSIRAGRWQRNVFVEGYEGEWDGAVFHGIGRLTMPIDTFFGMRASNSTLKLTDISAILNEASAPPPPPPPPGNGSSSSSGSPSAEEATHDGSSNGGWMETVSPTSSAPGRAKSMGDAMWRADASPHFIDFFGVFRNGVRDGLGMLKLPALDCLIGGTLALGEDRRPTGKHFAASSSSGGGDGATQGKGKSVRAAKGGTGLGSSSPLPDSSGAAAINAAAAAVPSLVIKGRWVREVLHCDKGVVAFPNGVVYIGGIRNGARNAGNACVWWPDGSVMESAWTNDAPSGSGVWYQRNRADPIYQTIIPSVLRRSRSRRVAADAPAVAGSVQTAGATNTRSSGGGGSGNLFGLSYLWGLVGLGFGGGDGDVGNGNSDAAEDADDDEDKPQRVLVDFHSHFAIACTWNPYAMDLSTYTRVVLPQLATQSAPLSNDTPWPLLMRSASMATAMASPAAWAAASSTGLAGVPLPSKSLGNTSMAATSFAATPPSPFSPTPRQLGAGAAALHLPEAPPKVSVGRANGTAVVYFESGVVLAGEWLSNLPRLAVPYRPWSAYDGFLAWQASRPAARNCMSVFPLWVAPRSQSCYSALLAVAPEDVRGEPKRMSPGGFFHPASMALSPLATGGDIPPAAGAGAAEGGSDNAAFTSPETRCTICTKEYSFFRKRVHCTLCLRSTCSSCLGQMDTEGHRQEDVKAVLRHAYATSELTQQLAAAVAKGNSNTSMSSSSSGAARRVAFPSIAVEQVERAFDAKGISTVPVCADCVRAVLWKLRYTQLWIPTSMFASVVDIERHQRDARMERRASAMKSHVPDKMERDDGDDGAGVVPAAELISATDGAIADSTPCLSQDALGRESTRQISSGSELLPASQEAAAAADADVEEHTPTSQPQRVGNDTADTLLPEDSPKPDSPSTASRTAVDASSNRNARIIPDLPRPSGELLPPSQYITYSGYTSHSIPHIYGELWWGRKYYYRGGFSAGERHGFGVQYMPNGERYEGAFERDTWHGQGVYYLEDGSALMGQFHRGELRVVQYHGEVEEDTVVGVRPHGRGIGYDPDGSLYNGEWVHGQRHGTGMLHFPDGVSVYSGTFVGNAMEGMGKLVTTSGAYYGDFSQNQQQGRGLLFTGNCVVEGNWVHGASSGFTRIYESDTGEVYETTYRDGNERDDCFSAPVMVDDAEAAECGQCGTAFSFFLRRHHCRLCGDVFCDACSQRRATLPANFAGDGDTGANAEGLNATINPNTIGQRVCDACFYRLTQRRMVALRRYRDGSIYAGCWSQGRWVAQGLYCRPDGIFIVMDKNGKPLISADWTRVKMAGSTAATATDGTGSGATADTGSGAEAKAEPGKKVGGGVPPGGLGVSRRPARTILPISPSILQDAAPAKEMLDTVKLINESSSRRDLDAFLMWWATTRSRCGLQVPLDVLLVSKYQRMPAQLLRGDKRTTVTMGSDAAAYLACPPRCTLLTPHTPTLTPIRLFVTLEDSRKAMQAMVDGEVRERDARLARAVAAAAAAGEAVDADGTNDAGKLDEGASDSRVDTSPLSSGGADATNAAPSRMTTEERRVIDSDVEAAALRASRFMPVAIPRAPTVPITPATVSTTSLAAQDDGPSLPGTAVAPGRDRVTEESSIGLKQGGGGGSRCSGTPAVDVDRNAFGLTAWATRTPPSIDDADITDEALMTRMREERLAWPSTSSSPSAAPVGPLMPPTPTPPSVGANTAVSWDVWTTREIPRYTPSPLLPVVQDEDATPRNGGSPVFSSSPASPQQQPLLPRSEADLYFACPFWEPTVPDAQMLLEQGKMTQAARLMRRLQREHVRADNTKSSSGGDDFAEEKDDDEGAPWGSAGGVGSSPGKESMKTSGSMDTLDVLQQMQSTNGTGTGVSWTVGGLFSAEQRAQSGGGWAPAPMHGPFTFNISATEKRPRGDEQQWCFKVRQEEIFNF